MGLGGYLTWTAAFHEIHKATGKLCVPGEQYQTGFFAKSSPIFYNNPTVASRADWSKPDYINIAMNNPATNYCKHDSPERAIQCHDKHIILQILEYYGLSNIKLEDVRCRLYLDPAETVDVDRLLALSGLSNKPFLTIESSSNTEYTVNKAYPHDKWQRVVDGLRATHHIIQIGTKQVEKLEGVVDLRGQTTFRTAAGIIGRSKMFMSTEGGLVHAATAFDVPSLVVVTGFSHPNMTAYPANTNLWIHGDHGPCGFKVKCQECWKHVCEHDPNEIIYKARKMLGE